MRKIIVATFCVLSFSLLAYLFAFGEEQGVAEINLCEYEEAGCFPPDEPVEHVAFYEGESMETIFPRVQSDRDGKISIMIFELNRIIAGEQRLSKKRTKYQLKVIAKALKFLLTEELEVR